MILRLEVDNSGIRQYILVEENARKKYLRQIKDATFEGLGVGVLLFAFINFYFFGCKTVYLHTHHSVPCFMIVAVGKSRNTSVRQLQHMDCWRNG